MKEQGILFKAPMVRAILSGAKTQTRRIVKPMCGFEHSSILKYGMPHAFDPWAVWWHGPETDRVGCLQECPYGKPGDRLWVRETWCNLALDGYDPLISYRADDPPDASTREGWGLPPGVHWRPSIFMPRWASRITLEVDSIRVERIQDISDRDCFAEGIQSVVDAGSLSGDGSARGTYRALWIKINGAGSWEKNPFVWVVEFRRLA